MSNPSVERLLEQRREQGFDSPPSREVALRLTAILRRSRLPLDGDAVGIDRAPPADAGSDHH